MNADQNRQKNLLPQRTQRTRRKSGEIEQNLFTAKDAKSAKEIGKNETFTTEDTKEHRGRSGESNKTFLPQRTQRALRKLGRQKLTADAEEPLPQRTRRNTKNKIAKSEN